MTPESIQKRLEPSPEGGKKRRKRKGYRLFAKRRAFKTCTIDGCSKSYYALGWCAMHYQRDLKNGTTSITWDSVRAATLAAAGDPPPGCKFIPLTRGLVATVDEADYERVSRSRWCAVKNKHLYYAASRKFGKLHRYVMKARPGSMIDHANGNTLDNRRSNLRFCTAAENARNTSDRSSSSQYKGVSRDKHGKKWLASIRYEGRQRYLGLFAEQEDAAICYDVAAQIFYGEFARLNFPLS